MNYVVTHRGAVTVVRIEEERATVLQGVDDLKTALVGLADGGHANIVVDMSRVEFADSSMLGALVSALKMATRRYGDVKLAGITPQVRAVLEMTRLYRVFEIFDAEDDAVASF